MDYVCPLLFFILIPPFLYSPQNILCRLPKIGRKIACQADTSCLYYIVNLKKTKEQKNEKSFYPYINPVVGRHFRRN